MDFYFWAAVKEHFDAHLKYYIFFGSITVIGLIVGIGSAAGLGALATSADLKIFFFEQVKISGTGLFGLAGKNLIILVSLNLIIFAVCINIYLLPLCVLLLVFRGYIIGFNMVIILRVFGAAGIFNVLVVYIPFHLITLFCVVAAASVCARRCIKNSCFGPFEFRCVDYPYTLKTLAVILAAGFLANLAVCIICSIFFQGMILVF